MIEKTKTREMLSVCLEKVPQEIKELESSQVVIYVCEPNNRSGYACSLYPESHDTFTFKSKKRPDSHTIIMLA